MSPSVLLFFVASFSVFLGERMFAEDTLRWPIVGLGVILWAIALGMRARTLATHPKATRLALGLYGLASSAVVFYLLQQKDTVDSLGMTGESAVHFRAAMQAGMALVYVIGVLPAVAIDGTLHASPKSVHPLRLTNAWSGGLAVAFGLAMLFPLNFLAKEHNERWNFGYFRTTAVGTATRNVVENLTDPMRVVLFFEPSSEVLREIEPYFDDLAGDTLSVEVMDQAMAPDVAKEWKVKDNGNVVFIRGEGEDERTEVVKIGTDIDAARKELRKLDSKVQTALIKLSREKKTAYFTVGHDELYWKNAGDDLANIDLLKKAVEGLNFKVKELGIDDGLANAVPDDAAVVFVVGPKRPFLPEEIAALRDYRDRGGSLFLMLEQGDEPDPALGALLGVAYERGPIASEDGYVKVNGGLSDRTWVGSNKFGSHESVTTLNKNSSQAYLLTPNTGALTELGEHAGKYTATVKGMPRWWLDTNGNYEFDRDSEKKGGYEVAGVATGPASGDSREWRGVVVASATWASNTILRGSQANAVYLFESLGWLTNDPALSGETQSEEDVKIQHTKEGEAVWFYGTTVLVPALVFVAGLFRVSRRRSKGAA